MIFSIQNLFIITCLILVILIIYHLAQYFRKIKLKSCSSYELTKHKVKLEAYYVVTMILVALYVILTFIGVDIE